MQGSRGRGRGHQQGEPALSRGCLGTLLFALMRLGRERRLLARVCCLLLLLP